MAPYKNAERIKQSSQEGFYKIHSPNENRRQPRAMHKENREEMHVPRTYNAQEHASWHPLWEGSPNTPGALRTLRRRVAVPVPEVPRGQCWPCPARPTQGQPLSPCLLPVVFSEAAPPGQRASPSPPPRPPRGGKGGTPRVWAAEGGGRGLRGEPPHLPVSPGPRTHPPAVG